MPQIYDMGPTALFPLRRKACWEFLRPKNPTASAEFEPVNLGTKGQHATPRPPKPQDNIPDDSSIQIIFHFKYCALCLIITLPPKLALLYSTRRIQYGLLLLHNIVFFTNTCNEINVSQLYIQNLLNVRKCLRLFWKWKWRFCSRVPYIYDIFH